MKDLTIVLESARISSGRLELTPVAHPREPDSAERPTWDANLTAENLAASIVTPESSEQERTLAEFFDWIYDDRLGWDGEREWESDFGAMHFTAVHDQINVVRLRVALRGGIGKAPWTAIAELHMDPGRFQRLSANAALYFDRFRGAAEETYY